MTLNDFPLVSVIIPFYNHNHFVKQTLDSIIEDSYPNKEIIIINDGSTNPDDTNITKWIKEHQNIITKYIKRENKGLTKTLNELVTLSSGKYIVVLASDDYLINNTITNRVKTLEINTEKLILLSDNIVIDDNNNQLYSSNLFEFHNTDKNKYFTDIGLAEIVVSQWSFAGPSWIANKKIFTEYGFYFNEKLIVEDWDFFLKIISKNLALFYDEKVSAYRLHENNTSNNDSKKLKLCEDLYSTALTNLDLFDNHLKEKLLFHANEYKRYIKREKSFLKKIKVMSKPVRHKLKYFFHKTLDIR
jgi:glycosyltransferase involved in cell wall biosynthesis